MLGMDVLGSELLELRPLHRRCRAAGRILRIYDEQRCAVRHEWAVTG